MKRIVVVATFLALATVIHADDWPQWRGPKRDGVSAEKGLLKDWPKGGPKLAWQFKNAGLGFSSFAIRDGKVYTLGSRDDNEIVLVLDAKTGAELWIAKIGPVVNAPANSTWGDGPRATPTLDGDLLFALGSQADLVCFDLTKKTEVWRTNLEKDYGGVLMTGWGYSESPFVDGDKVIVTPGGQKGTFLALDKKTGKMIWQCQDVKENAPYSSVMPADFNGVRQYIQLSYLDGKGGKVNGVDAKSGKLLWQAPIFKADSYAAAPTPIVTDKGVYVTTGYGGGCHFFEIGKDWKAIDKFGKKETGKVKNTHGGVVLVDGHIYGHSEPSNWVCQDVVTGKLKWEDRVNLTTTSGSIAAADGMLYLYTDEGECALVTADPTAGNNSMPQVASFTIPEKSKYPETRKSSRSAKVWNHPVISDGHLYLRDCELIFCYDIRGKK